jgi:hypothetical protein
LTARSGDVLVMLHTEQDVYIGLTKVGARIWDMIETPREMDEIYARLMEGFEVEPSACRADVDSFVADLVRHRAAELI